MSVNLPDRCDVVAIDKEKTARLRGRADEVRGMADVFRALGDDTRTRILYLLSLEELCVCDLAHLLGASISSISHHLRLLRALRLVRARRDGKMVFYSPQDGHISHLIEDMKEHMVER